MQIIRAAVTGMCFGVRDALREVANIKNPDSVTIHGELVHNALVLYQLGARGFRMVGENERHEIPETPKVLITAHGVSDTERKRLEQAGKSLVDTTCPLVRRVHESAKGLQTAGYFVLVVGRKSHVEVRGIVEDLTEHEVIENASAVRTYPFSRIGVVCQTTTPPQTLADVHLALVHHNPRAELQVIDTICHPTRDHLRALDELLPIVDLIVVVGGQHSNNTRELAARARAAGRATMHVQGASDLRFEWFSGLNRVGLTAGTSTLDATIDAVEARIREFAAAQDNHQKALLQA